MQSSLDGIKKKSTKKLKKQSLDKDFAISDSQKRAFIKTLGVVGAGAMVYSMFPKKASALMFGSSPNSTEATAIKNIAGTVIDPATEETLQSVAKDQTLQAVAKEATLQAVATETTLQNVATEATLQSVAGMNVPKYDYISASYPDDTTEVYTYKTGGSSGTTVATIHVLYLDSSKEKLVSIRKS